MYHVYFDSGTSNTRAYLLEDENIIDVVKESIGSKDSSIAGSNTVLIKSLKKLYDKLLDNNQLKDRQINDIYASGMITCPFGIKEIPHLSTPISPEKLYTGIYIHYESQFFKRDIYLVRGAKTISDNFPVDKYNISAVNNMRGEEIEVFGMIPQLPDEWQKGDIAVFLPGSHTHIAYIKQGVLYDILSTFSGELYHAIATSTILSNSIQCDTERLDEAMVIQGYRNLREYGLNRALYIGHAMKIFNASDNLERKSYLEGVITGGVVLGFEKTVESKWDGIKRVLIAGSNNLARVYEILLQETQNKYDLMTFVASGKQSYAVKGFIELLKIGGQPCQKQF